RFQALNQLLGSFAITGQATSREEAALWDAAFTLLAESMEAGRPAKAMKRRLLDYLWKNAPFLAKSFAALRVNFGRKMEKWEAEGCSVTALLDGREQKRGVPCAPAIPVDDLDTLIWHINA